MLQLAHILAFSSVACLLGLAVARIVFAVRTQPVVSACVEPRAADLWRPVPSKVLFLDFDGVLHRKMTGTFEHLPLFERWLRSTEDLGIVISSSWRDEDRSYLEGLFSQDLRDRLIGRTIKEGLLPSRQAEVVHFVNSHHVADFVVLDDDNHEFEPNWPFRIATEYVIGLTERQMLQLSDWLSASSSTQFRRLAGIERKASDD